MPLLPVQPPGATGKAASTQPSGQLQSANGEYVVAYADGASTAAALAAVKRSTSSSGSAPGQEPPGCARTRAGSRG